MLKTSSLMSHRGQFLIKAKMGIKENTVILLEEKYSYHKT